MRVERRVGGELVITVDPEEEDDLMIGYMFSLRFNTMDIGKIVYDFLNGEYAQ